MDVTFIENTRLFVVENLLLPGTFGVITGIATYFATSEARKSSRTINSFFEHGASVELTKRGDFDPVALIAAWESYKTVRQRERSGPWWYLVIAATIWMFGLFFAAGMAVGYFGDLYGPRTEWLAIPVVGFLMWPFIWIAEKLKPKDKSRSNLIRGELLAMGTPEAKLDEVDRK